MDFDIFKTPEEKAQAVKTLIDFELQEGWSILLKALDANLEFLNDQLQTERFNEVREVERLQDQISHLRKLKLLPKLLVQEIQNETNSQEEDSADPFEPQAPLKDPSQPI